MNNEQNKPASKSQLWALFCATKEDYRNKGLTYDQAHDLLQELAKETGYQKKSKTKSGLKEFMLEHVDDLYGQIKKILNLPSIVTVEALGKKSNFAFFGGGCGFSYIKYNRNNKKAAAIVKEGNDIREMILGEISKKIGKDVIKYLDNLGTPIRAIYSQDLSFNDTYNSYVIQYMRMQGILNVSLDSHYD